MTVVNSSQSVSLEPVEADELAHLLRRLHDWLHTNGGDAVEDLVAFLDGPGNGRLAAAGLLHTIDTSHAILRRRMREMGL